MFKMKFPVTVPEGGVKEGESFFAEVPDDEGEKAGFRYKLFDCFSVASFKDPMFWSAWCCSGLFLGQLLQRLKMTFYGMQTDDDQYKMTCKILSVSYFVALLIGFILVFATGTGVFVTLPFFFYMTVLLVMIRSYLRKKYEIPTQYFDKYPIVDDICYSFFCTCCTLYQLGRQTHDETEYKYQFDSPTGLPEDAPEVV